VRFILIFIALNVFGPLRSQTAKDSIESVFSSQRFTLATTGIGLTSIGSIYGLNKLWYSNENQSSFHLFNDSKNWMQMDKMGHAFTVYHLTRGLKEVYAWTGLSQKKSLWTAAGISMGYLSAIEILDGFSESWGFSLSDMAFNSLGMGLYLFQEQYFQRQIFKPKFSFHQTRFAIQRPEVLGNNFLESLLKDYNGQTYWLSFSPGQLGVKQWPNWLMLSFGHSIKGRLKGDALIYDGTKSHRELLFSLDIDLSQISVKSKLLKNFLEALNTLKLPFPSILFSNGKLTARPLYF
jgi:hypothetical protein